ncbi:helicase-related protein [Streptobacillus moniliformis]|uniref:helicase-related protein n=1 Tax=Streptobacillus moniliformis TaxID=34105 RepID=UPI0007E482CA|nr:DEAD/DEAH box helicase [Streptobacillus moniliformis]
MEFLTELLPHQKKAIEKLSKLKVCALFMDRGTGKTRTILELIKIKLNKEKINHILWLCPCNIKENSKKDIIKHLGFFPGDLITIAGIETLSSSIKANLELIDLVNSKKVYLIVDESTKVKNKDAIRSKRIINLSKKCEYKAILNGTPITKNQIDLFSQFYILDWRILGYKTKYQFEKNHVEYDKFIPNKVVRIKYINYIAKKIEPYSFEVKKEECINLPNRNFKIEYFNIDKLQRLHYDYIFDKLLYEVDEMKPHTIYNLLYSLQSIVSGFEMTISKISDMKDKTKIIRKRFYENEERNPRTQKLIEVLKNLNDSKTIICCTYLEEVNSIIKVLKNIFNDKIILKYTGEISQKEKNKNIVEFEINKNIKYLIATKQSIGLGLNLQFCNNIVYYSNDYDLGTKLQSQDRIYRIGQNENVNIIDIVAENTIDSRIIDCLNRKENMLENFLKLIKEMKNR